MKFKPVAWVERGTWRNLLIAIPAGVIAALVTILFRSAITYIDDVIFHDGSDITQAFAHYSNMMWPLITGIGGVLAGYILYCVGKYEKRHGTMPDYLDVIDQRLPEIPLVSTLLRAGSSLASIASGGSIGREGAMVQLSALGGSLLAKATRRDLFQHGDVVAMAAAGGLAAVYHAPLAGALFVAEIAFGMIMVQRLVPLLIAASAAVLTVRLFSNYQPLYFYASAMFEPSTVSLLTVLLVGGAAGLLGPLFLMVIDFARHAMKPLANPVLRLGLGGLFVGLVAMLSPLVLGNGFEVIELMLDQHPLAISLLLLLVLKILATAITVGSGAVGGLFTPSLLVGAACGALICGVVQGLGGEPGPSGLYAAMGMCALLAATSHAPLMSILMAFEMTQNNSLLFPLMLATALASVVAAKINYHGTYPVLARHQAKFSAKSQFESSTLATLVIPCSKMYLGARLAQVVEEGLNQRTRYVYMVDKQERFVGVVATNVLAAGIINGSLRGDQAVDGFIEHQFTTLYQDASYPQAWAVFSASPLERLPVLADKSSRRLLGVVTKASLLNKAREFL
jgi:CIC family chloride channel protein